MRFQTLLAAALVLATLAPAQTDRKCGFTPFGDSCGPKLAGKFAISDRGFAAILELSNAPKSAASVMALATTKLTVTLPNKCKVFVLPFSLGPFRTSATGTMRWVLPVPPKVKGTLLFQTAHVAGDKGAIVTSNGLKMGCR